MFVAAIIFQGMRLGKNLNICHQFAKNVPRVTWFFKFGKPALSICWSFHANLWVKLQLNHLEIFTKILSNIRFFQHPPPEISLINAQNDIWPCLKPFRYIFRNHHFGWNSRFHHLQSGSSNDKHCTTRYGEVFMTFSRGERKSLVVVQIWGLFCLFTQN